MNDETRMLLKLTEQNTRLKLAIENLRHQIDERKKADRSILLDEEELSLVFLIAGYDGIPKECICYDNCNEIAYKED